MNRSIIQKAGTVFLSTATGFCILSAEAAWGQVPISGPPVPSSSRQLVELLPPSSVDDDEEAEIAVPFVGHLPKVPARPQIVPRAGSHPGTEAVSDKRSAPPIAAITPGPSARPLPAKTPAALVSAQSNSFLQPDSVSDAEESQPDSAAKEPLLTESIQSTETGFEMPLFVKPATPEETPKAEKAEVASPPLLAPPNKSTVEIQVEPFESAWQPDGTKPAPNREPIAQTAALPSQENLPPKSEGQPVVQREAISSQEGLTTVEAVATESAGLSIRPVQTAEVGLEGQCPVTLRDERKQIPGKGEHASQWQGTVYRLASAQAKQRFDAHPELYVPAEAGLDVTLMSNRGQKVRGSLQHALWYRRQLYLFQDNTTLKAFTANPERYVKNE